MSLYPSLCHSILHPYYYILGLYHYVLTYTIISLSLPLCPYLYHYILVSTIMFLPIPLYPWSLQLCLWSLPRILIILNGFITRSDSNSKTLNPCSFHTCRTVPLNRNNWKYCYVISIKGFNIVYAWREAFL